MIKEINFNDIPHALVYLIDKVESIEQSLQALNEQPNAPVDGWMNLKELQDYLPDHPAKPTIYGWVSQRQIPHHKGGKRLRFLKSEIDKWLSAGKRKCEMEMEAEATGYLNKRKGG